MELTAVHTISMLLTIGIVIGCGLYSARSVQSAEGFSLAGRRSGVKLIAGSIAGTAIGGGATVGTAQTAYSLGLSAWWLTLGVGIGLIILGLAYARPLRQTGLETIPQLLVMHYGKKAGPVVSLISSLGILVSAAASSLPGVQLLAAFFQINIYLAAGLLVLLVTAYVFLGGMKGAGVSGFLKLLIIWFTLFLAGGTACLALANDASLAALPAYPWFSLVGAGVGNTWGNFLSMVVGMLCTQTYIQAIYSASDAKTAAVGAFTAALVVIPVGLPSVAIGMFMHLQHPDLLPILVLPQYLLQYQPPWLGGIGLAGIILSLIGSIAGLALGIGTMVAKDFIHELFAVHDERRLLWANRFTVLGVTCAAAVIALLNPQAYVLEWNYLSMALRGAGVFVPLTLAIFWPGHLSPGWALTSMLASTAAAVAATWLHSSYNPLFIGLGVSVVWIMAGIVAGNMHRGTAEASAGKS